MKYYNTYNTITNNVKSITFTFNISLFFLIQPRPETRAY